VPEDDEEDAAEAEAVVSAEIIVTASKRGEVNAQDLATTLTAFDIEKIERLDAVDFEDFIVQVPGTNFIDNGGPGRGQEVSSIRGLSPVADNTVAVVGQYLDGAPRFGNNYRLFDVGEISVLRGPQGTLWGSQAIGGLISYRSNRPNLSRSDYHFETDLYSTSDDGGLSSRLSGYANLPLIEDKLALRVAAHVIDETGYIDNVATGADDVNDVEEQAWRLSFLFKPSEAVSITTIYHGNDLTADAPSYFNPELGDLKSDAPLTLLPADQEYDLFNFIVDADLGWGSLNYTGSYFDLTNVYSDAERNFFGFIPVARTDTILEQESWTHELRLASANDGPFNWVVGLYLDDLDEIDLAETLEFTDPTTPGAAPVIGEGALLFFIGGPETFKEEAVFGEVTYDFSDDWQVLVGGRFFDWEVDNDQDTVFLGTGFGQETGSVGDDDSFFKVQLTHKLDEDKLVYLTRSEGFRIGGFNPFVGPNFNSSLDFLKFDPDRLINNELGLKSTWKDNRVLLNAAVYLMDWQDVQTVVFDSIGVFAFTANASDLEAEGFEVEVATQDLLAPGFYAAASFTYNDNEFTDDAVVFPGVGSLVSKGEKLRRTPKSTWAVDLGRDFTIGDRIAAYARANYWHKDATTTEGFNRGDGAVPIPAQDILNASAGAYFGNWEIKLALDNLTDERPFLQVFPGASTATGLPDAERAVRVSTLRPRTIMLKASYYR
jgi:outer membrane receptor protein involved in Fe transport